MKTILEHFDITVKASFDRLEISNSKLCRSFSLESGTLRTQSLQNSSKREFASPRMSGSDFSYIGLNMPDFPEHPCRIEDITAEVVPGTLFDSEHVSVRVKVADDYQSVRYTVEYFIYPSLPVLGCQCRMTSDVMPNIYWSHRRRFCQEDKKLYSSTDSFVSSSDVSCRYTVEFTGRTDYTDNVVIRHDIAGEGEYCGNILVATDKDSACGFAILQEAPPSAERRDFEPFDFKISSGSIISCAWGVAPEELSPGVEFSSNRSVVILFEDDMDFECQLKTYLQKRFPQIPGEASTVTVNPWGCGRFRSLVNRDFLLEEIKATSDVGATTYQIDDGWQGGGGLGELVINNRKMDVDFWQVSDMLGGSLDELIACFRQNGIEPGLWVAPSFNVEFEDYREFADLLYSFYEKYDICIFKIDGVKTRTWRSENNLRLLLEDLRKRSNGRIRFNLDTTNGQRPGYFLFLEYGNIFLENRYICHKWGVGYHPERTLRNLWKLARYMRSEKLQIEVANPGDMNEEFYINKGECLPSVYDFEYWVAVTMFANPLIWMTPSTVSKENKDVLKRMMTLHRREAESIFAGTVYPVGKMPDGETMTGFVSVSDSGVQLIIFREKDEASGKVEIKIPQMRGDAKSIEVVSGSGTCRVIDGTALVEIPAAPGYLWVKFAR